LEAVEEEEEEEEEEEKEEEEETIRVIAGGGATAAFAGRHRPVLVQGQDLVHACAIRVWRC
jgi:hypothetical protein